MIPQVHSSGKGTERAVRVDKGSSLTCIEERGIELFMREGNKVGSVGWEERAVEFKTEEIKTGVGIILQ